MLIIKMDIDLDIVYIHSIMATYIVLDWALAFAFRTAVILGFWSILT